MLLRRAYIRNTAPGTSLIEVMVVLGMVVLVASATSVMGLENYRSFAFQSERNTMVALLQQARSQAMNNVCLGGSCTGGKPHGVEFTTSGYTVFQGPNYSSRETSVDRYFATTYPVALTGNTSFTFNQLSGSTASAGTMIVSDSFGNTSTITITAQGGISWTH